MKSILHRLKIGILGGGMMVWVSFVRSLYAQEEDGGDAIIDMPGPLSLPSASGLSLPTGDLAGFVVTLVNAFLGILGIVVISYLIYYSVRYMTAGGDTNQVEEAKTGITNMIIGLLILAGAWVIANFILSVVTV